MTDARGVYTDSPLPYHGSDPTRDIAAALSVPQQLMQDLTGGANLVISGFTLTRGSGMQLQVAAGICWANGLRAATILSTLNITPTTTQPRYTIIRVTVTPNNPIGTDPITGNNLIADTNILDALDGTAGASPVKPTLGSPYQVQVGSILLPASTSALTDSMLNALDCAPNSIGPDGSELVSSWTHRATNITNSVTAHGIQQGSGHSFDSDTVDGQHASAFQTSGSFDAAGAAAAVQTNLNTETSARSGADTVLTNGLNAHEATLLFSNGGAHGVKEVMGDTGPVTVNNGSGGVVTFSISFGFTFTTVPNIQLTLYTAAQIVIQYGYDLSFFGRTTSGFTIQLGQVTGSNQVMGVCWRAVGS